MREVTPIKNTDGTFKLYDNDLRPMLVDDGRPSAMIAFKVSIPGDEKTYILFMPVSRCLLENPYIADIEKRADRIAQHYDLSSAQRLSWRDFKDVAAA